MPGQGYVTISSSSGGPALTINTPTTVVAVFGSTGPATTITEIGCTFEYNAASTGNPPMVQLVAIDGATTGTVTAQTPRQIYGWAGSTGQIPPNTTGRINYTAEPGALTTLKHWIGNIVIQNPLGREPITQATTGLLGRGYGLRVTVPSSSMLPYAYIQFEE